MMRLEISKCVSTALIGGMLLVTAAMSACSHSTVSSTSKDVMTLPVTRPAGEPGMGQVHFDSDDQAADALVAAVKARDHEAFDLLFGPSSKEFVSGDKVADEKAFDRFVKKVNEHLELEKKDANTTFIDIGKDNLPFPIPLTRLSNGKWFFDTEAGKQEILARRIGHNERETIKVCLAYVQAQLEYASKIRDDSRVRKYAQRFFSHPGQKDGLYWQAGPGEEQSPFGEFLAWAELADYNPVKTNAGNVPAPQPQPYHGYIYHILKCQGSDAPGGKYGYVINGNMIAGFALVAYPAKYNVSGVMTFIISHDGTLYQKDLGPQTVDVAKAMKEYNPDDSWTVVSPKD